MARYLRRALATAKQSVISRSNTTGASSDLIPNSSFFYGGISPLSTRGFAPGQTYSSSSDPNPNWSNRPPDFEYCIVMKKPEGDPTRDEIIDSYVKTLAMVVGSEEEARMRIYSVSTRYYPEFGALVTDEVALKITELPNVWWVVPDSYSYLYVRNKFYGGGSFINGQAVPYDPEYHEALVRNNATAYERNRRNDRPRPGFNMGAQPNPPLNNSLGASNNGGAPPPYQPGPGLNQNQFAPVVGRNQGQNQNAYPNAGQNQNVNNFSQDRGFGPGQNSGNYDATNAGHWNGFGPNMGHDPGQNNAQYDPLVLPYQHGLGPNQYQRGVGLNQGQNQNAYANVPSSGVGYPHYQNKSVTKNVTGRCMTPLLNPAVARRALHSAGDDEISDEDKQALIHYTRYCELIRHLCNLSRWREVKIWLRKMSYLGLFPDVSTCTAIIECFLKEDLIEEAEDVCSIMLRKRPEVLNINIFNSLMDGYCLQGRMNEAKRIFHKCMESWNIIPDTHTLNIASALMHFEELQAFAVSHKLQACGELPDFYKYCQLLSGLCREKMTKQALLLLVQLEDRGGETIHIAYYNVIMDELCQLKDPKGALEVFDGIKGVEPNMATYNIMIRGLCQYQLLDKAKVLFDSMKGKSVRPDGGIYNAMVQDNLRKKRYADALEIIEEMGKNGFCPNQFTFELVILQAYRCTYLPEQEGLQTCMRMIVALRQELAY